MAFWVWLLGVIGGLVGSWIWLLVGSGAVVIRGPGLVVLSGVPGSGFSVFFGVS